MQIMFIGAAHEVTGSCTLLEACGKHILIDCGMEQGPDIFENCELPVAPNQIDAICLTHAHIDHSGRIPYLVANGYSGPIYMTTATQKLATLMLRDSAHIQEFEAEWRNRKAQRSGGAPYVPLYTMNDVETTLTMISGHLYGEDVPVADGIQICFYDAGHLLGSSSIQFTITEDGVTKTITFSGDLGNTNRPIIRDMQCPPHSDYAVIESTYGDRVHEKEIGYMDQLTRILQETFDRGGNVVVPSFAVGRTQELLYLLRQIKQNHLVHGHENFPVYVDSPLAVEATNVYSSDMTDYYDEEAMEFVRQGINPITFPGLRLSITSDDSKAINEDTTPKVILSASGMCEAGRIRHHLKHNLWKANSTILFVGYQSVGTVGRKLLDGAPSVKIFNEEITVNARIEQINGFSSHSDRNMLLSWIGQVRPDHLFVNHGDEEVCDTFASLVKETYASMETTAPYSGDVYDLIANVQLAEAPRIRAVSKKNTAPKKSNSVYDRLVAAGKRLTALIESSKGRANKDLSRLTDQILSLCSKFE